LGIPAEVLLQEPKKAQDPFENLDWQKFPVEEMVQLDWITTKVKDVCAHAEELVQKFLAPLGGKLNPAFYRRTLHERSEKPANIYSLYAWTARVLMRAKKECCVASYKPETVTKDFLKEVARLSWFEQGPLLAREFLAKHGIALIIEPHLPSTRLDGAAMLTEENWPVIGLTLRHDRIDNFWYTLVHELSHVAKHLDKTSWGVFIDDDLDKESLGDQIEKEADKLTRETFIPRSIWMRSEAYYKRTPEAIKELAEQLKIHPAIIAGRIRRETENYTIFNDLVGRGQVKKLFKMG
jgi:HTH-type transcriptional regulator/antitoxin HigA